MKRSSVQLSGRTIFVPEIVTVDVGIGVNLVTDRVKAEKLLSALGVLPHNYGAFITGDPNAVDDAEIGPC